MKSSELIEKVKTHKRKFKRRAIDRHGRLAWQHAINAGARVGLDDIKTMFGPHPERIRLESYQKIANFLGFTLTARLGNKEPIIKEGDM